MSFRNLAIDAISKCMGYDPYLPRTEAMVLAWAEALEAGRITEREDVLMAVRVMYKTHGDPGWRPTPKVLVDTAKHCKQLRLEREESRQIEAPDNRITLTEFKQRHPDVVFPKFGKAVPSE